MSIPTQETADMNNPQEHLVWALRNMPVFAGAGVVTHPGFLRAWSEHLFNCGFRHVDWIKEQAGEDGMLDVSTLPRQTIKFQLPMRGPSHNFNNATRWVSVDAVEPAVVALPDIRQLTIQENEVMLQQYRDAGMIPAEPHGPVLAEEVGEDD